MSKIPQNNKTRIPLLAAVVIIIVVAIAGNYYMSNIFPSSTGTPMGGAKLLQFTVTLTKGGVNNGTYTYYTKNVDEINSSYKWGRAANFMMRKGTGDWTYNVNEVAVRIYDIKVNPLLSGSLFGPN
ncbi:MAG: hypothetical protein NTV15_00820 [Candidatus Bathyarchaeota archaeon]|nr:hypothetical protein [Candidatus Bathyarchaeota archaeon]